MKSNVRGLDFLFPDKQSAPMSDIRLGRFTKEITNGHNVCRVINKSNLFKITQLKLNTQKYFKIELLMSLFKILKKN